MKKIKVGICGASGYAGLELLRLLLTRDDIELIFCTSETHSGKKIKSIFPYLNIDDNLIFLSNSDEKIYNSIDVVFLSLPHEVSAKLTPDFINKYIKVIDLSAAYRIKNVNTFNKVYNFEHPSPDLIDKAIYGLCEIYREKIRNANLIANPGCYPTSILLPLIPLFKEGIINEKHTLIIDSKSGFSGRGKKIDEKGLFCEMNENFYAYSVVDHRHKPEIKQELDIASNQNINFTFIPQVIPVNRGIWTNIHIYYDKDDFTNRVYDILTGYYKSEPFIKILTPNILPELKWVQYTNNIFISSSYDANSKIGTIYSIIDNLTKGAAGQAIQNMNIIYGIEETKGLL